MFEEIVGFDIEATEKELAQRKAMYDDIPIHQPRWMKYEADEKDEELYEGQFVLFEDKNPLCQLNDWRFQSIEDNKGSTFPDDSNIKQEGAKEHPHRSCLWIIDIYEHWLSSMEMPNPYFAIRPNHEYKDGSIIRYNPNISEIYELNKVQRKQLDGVTRYMGQPSYIEDVNDRLIYYDVTCLDKDDNRISIKIFAPRYNRYFYSQINALTWAYKDGQRKLYIPAYCKNGRWGIDTDEPFPQKRVHRWVKAVFKANVKTYPAQYALSGNTFKSWDEREFYISDEECISHNHLEEKGEA